ncbi:metallophosphoesterase family protein [Aureliella helgolandensis]|uniref:Putative metallophosphoesterase YhaO n=1 Tax=Aureliella helgolandensis TaxID=2527968 RepID=A0A518G6Y3_9BACT|nr:metallophosphoesterase [Aureliella helgolandensis]QDV24336.1 putative metallophosphoesterase YhaO [Aureliella helgolandensis]
MAKESFRFIHASDFHLERPLQDILDLPEQMRKTLVEAPWRAAEAVFEHAVVENIDFVVLSGDILNPATSGSQGPAFLLDQFETLRGKGIQIYWAGGEVDDPDRWPAAVSLPDNVHLFSKHEAETFIFRRHQTPLVNLIGRSSSGGETVRAVEYANEADDNFVVAVGYGQADAESLASEHVDYWALGGRHQGEIVRSDDPVIRYAGSPQARSLKEPGPHGFVLVDVDAQRELQIHTIETDQIRYSVQEIDADDVALGRDLRQLLAKRVARLQSEASGRHVLVKWRVHLDLENASVVGPSAMEDLLGWLRREFGHGQPSCWSTDIEILPPKELPASWKEEDTILGDFLRTSASARKDPAKHINLKPIIDVETPGTNNWQGALSGSSSNSLTATIERSTLLGVDLLRGHKVDLVAPTRRFGGSEK